MIILHEPWVKAEKLYAEGEKLWGEGDKLWGEGLKLRDEGEKLRNEGIKHYLAAVKDFFGEDINVNCWTGKVLAQDKERAVMPFGELFGYV